MGSQRELIINGEKGNGLSPAQRSAAEERGHDVIVRAGAGSGKTKTLVARYLLLLDENRDRLPSDIAAVTFTEKAGNEMRSRIRGEMSRLAEHSEDSGDKAYWTKQLNEMDNACIGTIHSLCARILRAHPAEAGLDPQFVILDETEAAILTDDVIAAVLNHIAEDDSYTPLLKNIPEVTLVSILKEMLKKRSEYSTAMEKSCVMTKDCFTAIAGRVLENYKEAVEEIRAGITEAAFTKADDEGYLAPRLKGIVDAYDLCVQNLNEAEDLSISLKNLYDVFADWNLAKGKGAAGKLKNSIKSLKTRLEGDFSFRKDGKAFDIKAYDEAMNCLRKLWPLTEAAYLKALDVREALDFDELQEQALSLLRSNAAIRELWAAKFLELMVDEYQDTNDNQAELFDLLDPKHDHLFAVGDKKQSIYGFRGTNAALFDQRAEIIKSNGGADIALNISYRPDPELLHTMNVMLESLMADAELKDLEYYAPFEPMEPRSCGSFGAEPLVEILSDETGNEANMLAARLLELRAQGKLKSWGNAAILFRGAKAFRKYEKALELAGIPYVTVAGSGFYDRPEIRDVLNMLRAAEDPYNDSLTVGFLLSPVIGFTPAMLERTRSSVKEDGKPRSFLQTLTEDNGELFRDPDEHAVAERGKAILTELNHLAGRKRVDEVLDTLYKLTGYRDMLARQGKDRAWLNLDKLLMDARNSERVSVSEFLYWLETVKDAGAREGEAPSANEGAVRLMTIHKSKGLEFKLAIIASAEVSFTNRNNNSMLISPEFGPAVTWDPKSPQYADAKKICGQKDKSEWLRILYVAMTRAQERLIICGGKTGKKSDSWMNRILSRVQNGQFHGLYESVPVYFYEQGKQRDGESDPAAVSESGAADEVPVDLALLQPLTVPKSGVKAEKNAYGMAVGNMVHKALELEIYRDSAALNALLTRMLTGDDQLSAEDREGAANRVKKLLERFAASDICRRIESADERRHEVPYTMMYRQGGANSGIIDLLIREGGRYTVIDFKTDALDHESERRDAMERYGGQLGRYRRTLRRILGSNPECGLCFLDDMGETCYHLVPDESEPSLDDELSEDVPDWFEEDSFFED